MISEAEEDDHEFEYSLGNLTRYCSQREKKSGVWDVAQLVESLSSMHKTLGSVPHTPKLGVMVPTYNPSTLGGGDRRIRSLRSFSVVEKA